MQLFRPRLFLLTLLAMLAFAANSVFCRLALKQGAMDAASFTAVRLLSGAAMLCLLLMLRGDVATRDMLRRGNWPSACALLAYALGFSFAYVSLPTGTGALLLFGAVQVTMIGHGLRAGESLRTRQWFGFLLACAGLVVLLLPGVSTPPLGSALLMLGAGIAWGTYSLRGRITGNPLEATAGNFLRATPIALLLAFCMQHGSQLHPVGIGYAVASGALASGIGYAIWYSVLPSLKATTAATAQLSVPVIAAIAGTMLLAEPLTTRLLVSSVAVLGGMAMVLMQRAGDRQP